MSDGEITAAEVYRHLQRMTQQLDRIEHQMVPRTEFEAYKGDLSRRLARISDDKEGAHKNLHRRVDGVIEDQEQREHTRKQQARELSTKIWVAVIAAGLSVVGSLVLNVLGR